MSEALSIVGSMAPFVLFGGLALVYVVHYLKRAPGERQLYQTLGITEIARRLRIQVVEGDPHFAFVQRTGHGSGQRRVVLRGDVEGYPLELVWDYRRDEKIGFSEVTVTTGFECRLTSVARQSFPVFEVRANVGDPALDREPLLAPTATGHPVVDGAYVVRTTEPQLAALLGESLARAHGTLGPLGLHLYGDGRTVSLLMHDQSAPYVPSVLMQAEAAAALVLEITRRIGG